MALFGQSTRPVINPTANPQSYNRHDLFMQAGYEQPAVAKPNVNSMNQQVPGQGPYHGAWSHPGLQQQMTARPQVNQQSSGPEYSLQAALAGRQQAQPWMQNRQNPRFQSFLEALYGRR